MWGKDTHRAPGWGPADTSRKIPVLPPLIRDDEYCGTRFQSSRREARSIGTQPSNLNSVPYVPEEAPILAEDGTPTGSVVKPPRRHTGHYGSYTSTAARVPQVTRSTPAGRREIRTLPGFAAAPGNRRAPPVVP
ncbi:hypothetical protein GCM10010324_26260 [Streptomyces hiroshimensis]|uniref:Uncharacterized protein n=1 Tax=Streptomyces hiroshimensis TaxID=66424 RepID=A0ABQ2YET3_9ACTN|nr:hypothetical protein GCM10010324_26260 [Streptomyces hiroshimensis]